MRVAGFAAVLFSIAATASAQDFGVQTYQSPGTYEIKEFETVKDTEGATHVVCGGGGVIEGRDGLIERLRKVYGSGEDAEPKIAAFIKKVDQGIPQGKRCPNNPAPLGTPMQRFDAQRIYGTMVPYVFDLRTGGNVMTGEPFFHAYMFTFYMTRTDVDGKQFVMFDHNKGVRKENLLEEQAKLERKIRSPLSDQFTIKKARQDLAPIKIYLAKIESLESDPVRADYLATKLSVTANAERDSDDTVDCSVNGVVGKCPRNPSFPVTESRGTLTGTIKNSGDKTVLRAEITVDFMDKAGNKIDSRVYALPIDESIGDLGRRDLPPETFSLESNTSTDFRVKIARVSKEWTGPVSVKLTGVTFPEDYAAVLRKIRADYVKQQAAQRWQDQIAVLQQEIDQIDVRLRSLDGISGGMVKSPQ